MVRHGAREEDAFAEAFSIDHLGLAEELRGYLRSFRFPSIETTADIDLDEELEIREMPYAEVLYRLGELLAIQEPERPERVVFFETSVEVDPAYGLPISALAVEAERRAEWETARGLHERASKISPDDPIVLYRWGEFMRRRGGEFRPTASILARSTELDPSFAPAWAALAAVYADAGVTSHAALEAARTAYSMRPADLAAARDLVRLYLRLDRRAEAVSLIEGALQSNRRLRASMWTLVIQNDLLRVRELVRDDRLREATQRLEMAEASIDRSLYPEAARFDIERTGSLMAEQHAATLYHQAKQMISEGDRPGARACLVRALELVEDGPVASACRKLIEMIDHPEREVPSDVATIGSSPTPDEIARLNQLIASKDYHSAVTFLEDMRTNVGPFQQEWVDDRIREIQRAIAYGNFVDAYNHAVDFYNEGRFEDAIEVLERLLETMPEGLGSEDARALLDDAIKAQK